MLSKMEAVIEAGILPDVFRSICEIIKIDPDQKYFNIVEINQIKEYAGVRSKPIEKILSGYTAEECAEMLGVKVSSFRSNYAPSLEKIRRGVFKKESVHSLMAQLGKEDEVIQMEEKPVTYEKPKEIKKPAGMKRIQRLSVSTNDDEGVVVQVYLENITHQEALQKIVGLFS